MCPGNMLILAVVFKAKVGKAHEASRERQIKRQDAARQSRENIIRIAQNGSFSMVLIVIILIPAGLLKLKRS